MRGVTGRRGGELQEFRGGVHWESEVKLSLTSLIALSLFRGAVISERGKSGMVLV